MSSAPMERNLLLIKLVSYFVVYNIQELSWLLTTVIRHHSDFGEFKTKIRTNSMSSSNCGWILLFILPLNSLVLSYFCR